MRGLNALLTEIAKTKVVKPAVRSRPVCGTAVKPRTVNLSSKLLASVDTSKNDYHNTSSSRLRLSPEGLVLPPLHFTPPPKLTEETAMSFDEWKQWGAWVKKGSKTHIRDCLGIPQFTKEQVTPPKGKNFPPH